MLQEQRDRLSLLYEYNGERAGLQLACAVRILRFRDYAGYETLDKSNEHVQNLVCLQFCSKCENISVKKQDCIQCGKRTHSFCDDLVGDVLIYLCEFRTWVENIIVIAHNAAEDLHFILNRTILLK